MLNKQINNIITQRYITTNLRGQEDWAHRTERAVVRLDSVGGLARWTLDASTYDKTSVWIEPRGPNTSVVVVVVVVVVVHKRWTLDASTRSRCEAKSSQGLGPAVQTEVWKTDRAGLRPKSPATQVPRRGRDKRGFHRRATTPIHFVIFCSKSARVATLCNISQYLRAFCPHVPMKVH